MSTVPWYDRVCCGTSVPERFYPARWAVASRDAGGWCGYRTATPLSHFSVRFEFDHLYYGALFLETLTRKSRKYYVRLLSKEVYRNLRCCGQNLPSEIAEGCTLDNRVWPGFVAETNRVATIWFGIRNIDLKSCGRYEIQIICYEAESETGRNWVTQMHY